MSLPTPENIMAILTFLALLSILIIAHELGHFWVARKCGMKVERFGFGLPFGPTLWSKKIGEVEYIVHACLVGGYVAFPDDDPDSPVPKDSPERFENQPVLNRFLVAIAGITVNAILGWLIMIFVFMYWGVSDLTKDVTIYQTVGRDVPAAQAGFESGDVITAVNGTQITGDDPGERVKLASQLISANPKKEITISVVRKVKSVPVNINLAVTPDAKGKVGVHIGPGEGPPQPVTSVVEAGKMSFIFLSNFVKLQFEALGKIFTGQANGEEIGGPIRIVQQGGQAIEKHGIQRGLTYMAIISVILAVMNVLPIPGLDGGHIMFISIEAIKGSPLNRTWQERITQVGFAGLMVLMVLILGNDVLNITLDFLSKAPK